MILAAVLLATQINACNVLTKADIAAVQGETFTAATLTDRKGSTTCFYQLPTFTKSVSVDVILDRGEEYWDQRFDG